MRAAREPASTPSSRTCSAVPYLSTPHCIARSNCHRHVSKDGMLAQVRPSFMLSQVRPLNFKGCID
eukprot:1351190-Rhodomonas_salina.3